MNEFLLKKIQNEEALTADEQATLDLALDTESVAVRTCMTGLIDEEPSMAWRSGLNERLMALLPTPAPSKSAELDVQLESGEQMQTAAWVQNLDDEEPSMAWRSQLNEKLLALRTPAKRKSFWHAWRWAGAGAMAAGALAIVMFLNAPKDAVVPEKLTANPSSIEAGLIAAHQESAGALDLGSNTRMPMLEGGKPSSSSMWTDADLETL